MEIVVTHDMSDFDGFAGCVAAQRLYPDATIVLGRSVSAPVRDFLALHKDRFRTIRFSELRPEEVRLVVVVDVRRRSRLGWLEPVLERADRGEVAVHVWDHHASEEDDLAADVEHVAPVGSATTLLIEEIRRRGLPVDPVEATLYAVGVYADTGALTYAATTARDAHVVAWLLERGASLSMINRYLRVPFTTEQRLALEALLDGVEVIRIGGVEIGVGIVELPRPVEGLAEVTSEAIELLGLPALFGIFVLADRRIQVVARARRSFVDVSRPMVALGGGGHPPAAAATLKHADAEAVQARILEELRADPPQPVRVADLMSSPVCTVPHDLTFGELRRLLGAAGYTGAPVLRDGRLAGIVSRRDLEDAAERGDLHVPVTGGMSHEVVTTTPEASLEDALTAMVERDVGRLPVLRGGRLVGIVTRSDLLRALYPEAG